MSLSDNWKPLNFFCVFYNKTGRDEGIYIVRNLGFFKEYMFQEVELTWDTC